MIDDDENDRRKNEMLWKEKRRMKKKKKEKKKGRDEIEKDVDDKVMIWGSEKVCCMVAENTNQLDFFIYGKTKQTNTNRKEWKLKRNKKRQMPIGKQKEERKEKENKTCSLLW